MATKEKPNVKEKMGYIPWDIFQFSIYSRAHSQQENLMNCDFYKSFEKKFKNENWWIDKITRIEIIKENIDGDLQAEAQITVGNSKNHKF